jgi:hypothetical protein
VSLKGAAVTRVVTSGRRDAERVVRALSGVTEPIAMDMRPAPSPATPASLQRHLPHPYAQARPHRGLPVLEPLPSVPAYAAAEMQLGNVLFVTPRPAPFVNEYTRLWDNSFVPGPHATGNIPPAVGRRISSVLTSRAPSRGLLQEAADADMSMNMTAER